MKTSNDLPIPAQGQARILVGRAEAQAVIGTRRKYSPPSLIYYGEIRSLTLGPSAGIGESGTAGSMKA